MFERQVDINSVIGQYHQILTALIEKDSASLPTMIEGVSVLNKVLDVKEDVGELKTILGMYFMFNNYIYVNKFSNNRGVARGQGRRKV